MAQTKTINGQELPASAFLYVPDPAEPSTWKLPVKDASGEPNLGRVAAAAAALSPGGFRGQKADIPAEDLPQVRHKLVALYKRLGRSKKEIPPHLLEAKAEAVCEDGTCTLVQGSLGGSVLGVTEAEHKGQRGLLVTAIMNSLGPDTYRDWALLTPELKASTEDYFENRPLSMIQHGRPYRSMDGKQILSPIRDFVGYTLEHSYDDDGIHITDFVPEPAADASPELQRGYAELKAGEFNGVSVAGFFYRDTGLRQPPGLIIDWDLVEHSYCRNCVDQEAVITGLVEMKAKPDTDEPPGAWDRIDPDNVNGSLASAFAEFKAKLDVPDPLPEEAAEAQEDAAEAADEATDAADAADLVDTLETALEIATELADKEATEADEEATEAATEAAPPTETKAAPAATVERPDMDQPASGMDLYLRDKPGPSGVPTPIPAPAPIPTTSPGVAPPVAAAVPASGLPIAQTAPALEQKAVPVPPEQAPTPDSTNPILAAPPATPSPGGTMNENQNELLQQMAARLEALETEKKARELELEQERRDREARETAERKAREIAEAAAAAEAEEKALVEKYTQDALARYNIQPVGGRFAMPAGATGAAKPGAAARPRYTMAGPVVEEKARIGSDGNELPANIIDWLLEVKSGQRQAQWLSWTAKFGPEAKATVMGVPGATTNSPSGSAGGFALPVQYLEEIVPLLIDQFSIRSLITVYPANAVLLEVPKMATRATRAVVTAEGDTKPKTQIGTDMIPIRLFTLPQIVDVTNQLLNFSRQTAEQFVREQLADAIRLAEFFYALQGNGTNEPMGLIPALEAANTADATKFYVIHQASGTQPTGAAVPNTETLPDVVARAINVTQLRFYDPDALLVHPNIWWKLITTKDNYGRYLVDANMTGQVNSVWGIRVVHTTQLPQGKAVVGNWKKLRMYIAQDVTVDISNEAGDRWDKNLTGFRIEEMMGLDARQELDAFTEIDFTTAGVSSS